MPTTLTKTLALLLAPLQIGEQAKFELVKQYGGHSNFSVLY